MKYAAASLAALLPALGLLACAPKTEPPATETAATAPAVCEGPLTPIAGVCTADAAFLGNDGPKEILFDPKCVWKMQEVQRTPDEVLVFRVQDCTATGRNGLAFSYAFPNPTELTVTQDVSPDQPIINVIAQVFDIPAGQTAEAVAMSKLADAPEAERARCKTRPDAMGATFQLAPDDAFLDELQRNQDGPLSACGPFGYTEDSQVWWEAHGTHAIFHTTGQDTPSWDPTLFVFYKRDSTGAWVKEAAAPAP
jgi:hypothetical protein